jgi:hypothetical protein
LSRDVPARHFTERNSFRTSQADEVAAAYRDAPQNVYDPACQQLTDWSDYARPLDDPQRISTLANLRWLNDASRAGTQTFLGVTLAPSWQNQETQWFQPAWDALYGAPPEGEYRGAMLPLESMAAGLGHFRDVAFDRGFDAAVEDARQQWAAAPGPTQPGLGAVAPSPIPGLHNAVENSLNPRNWFMGRLGAAARAQLPWPTLPFPTPWNR